MQRFGELWSAYTLTATKDLGGGSCLVAAIIQDKDDEGKINYCTDIYKAERGEYGLFHSPDHIKRETFSNLWDAIRFCETVDLSEFGITNE